MPAHLAAVKWLAAATRAETTGMELRSRELVFRPQPTGWYGAKGVWKDVYEKKRIVLRESRVEMASAGAVTLIFQAMLPWLLWGACWRRDGNGQDLGRAVPLRVVVEGGTNVTKSLSYEYLEQVLLPTVNKILGRKAVKCSLVERGWITGKTNVGSVRFDVVPFDPGETLKAFNISNRGVVTRMHVCILAPTPCAAAQVRGKVTREFSWHHPDVEIDFPVDEGSEDHRRLYLLLVAETSNGHRLAHDWLYDGRPKLGFQAPAEAIDRLVTTVIGGLERELAHGGCVDEHMQDQLIVFQALAEGRSTVEGRVGKEISLHAQTARWVAERLLDVRFEDGSCEGLGIHASAVEDEAKDQALAEGISSVAV